MLTDYSCGRCNFSISKLKEMAETGEKFSTTGGRTMISVKEVNSERGYIVFTRPSFRPTAAFSIDDLKFIHDLIHDGKIDNDYEQIDEIFPMWGNYISALLQHVGCSRRNFESVTQLS